MEITPDFIVGKEVLFLVPLASGIEKKEFLEIGTVAFVDEDRETASIRFTYHGYKDACDEVPFSHIWSVSDKENGTQLEIENFNGKAHDLRFKAPFGTHQIAEMAGN